MNPSSGGTSAALPWLRDLLDDAAELPEQHRARPYWSQRSSPTRPSESWPAVVHRVRGLVGELEREHFFAEVLGFECFDRHGESDTSPKLELGVRIGKPDLWDAADADWSESDLCDFIEVFHDLAARPTRGWHHEQSSCGFHPTRFSRKSGQSLYRWRINRLLDTTTLALRIADDGEDVGRMIRVAPTGLAALTHEALGSAPASSQNDVAHAIALFRARGSAREERRSAIVTLAGVLEQRRGLLKAELLRKDEDALFAIANRFDLRHRKEDQRSDYDDAFMEWIFFWYLGTVHLTNQLLARQSLEDAAGTAPAP